MSIPLVFVHFPVWDVSVPEGAMIIGEAEQ
jgi:hypothetical protein